MGYFDALASGSFKTTADGRRLFFPWGARGRGYVIPSEQDYQRLHRLVKSYLSIAMVTTIGLMAAYSAFNTYWAFVAAVIFAIAAVAFYVAWVPFLTRGLAASDERLTVMENISTQALTHSAVTLWLLLIGSLLFAAVFIFMLVADRSNWLVALPGIALCGACAVVFMYMLVLRRRAHG